MAPIEQAIKAFTGADEKARQAKERLNFLRNSAEAHLELAESEISLMLLGNGAGLRKLFIVPETVTAYQQGYTVQTTETATAGIGAAVDQFFSGDYKEGLKTVVQSAIDVLFNDTTTGETSAKYYFVALEHNAFVRVDVAFWKYYFEEKGLTDDIQQAFCYTFVKSVIDHTKVAVDTMVYLISEYAGDDEKVVADYIQGIQKLWKELQGQDSLKAAATAGPRIRAQMVSAPTGPVRER